MKSKGFNIRFQGDNEWLIIRKFELRIPMFMTKMVRQHFWWSRNEATAWYGTITYRIGAFFFMLPSSNVTYFLPATIFCIRTWYFDRHQQILDDFTTFWADKQWAYMALIPQLRAASRANNMTIITLN
jgi:hypothetical protein